MKAKLVDKQEDRITVNVKDVDVKLLNTLRRIVIDQGECIFPQPHHLELVHRVGSKGGWSSKTQLLILIYGNKHGFPKGSSIGNHTAGGR